MTPNDALAHGTTAHVLANTGSSYLVYLPDGGNAQIDLADGTYNVQWYNPRSGGALQDGSVTRVSGGNRVSLGNAPNAPNMDWAVLVTNTENQ